MTTSSWREKEEDEKKKTHTKNEMSGLNLSLRWIKTCQANWRMVIIIPKTCTEKKRTPRNKDGDFISAFFAVIFPSRIGAYDIIIVIIIIWIFKRWRSAVVLSFVRSFIRCCYSCVCLLILFRLHLSLSFLLLIFFLLAFAIFLSFNSLPFSFAHFVRRQHEAQQTTKWANNDASLKGKNTEHKITIHIVFQAQIEWIWMPKTSFILFRIACNSHSDSVHVIVWLALFSVFFIFSLLC